MRKSLKRLFCSHDWAQSHVPDLRYRLGDFRYVCIKCGKERGFNRFHHALTPPLRPVAAAGRQPRSRRGLFHS
ncbi:MAG: hypothetical protein ACOY4L_05330 [Pseudomonadota bacterium]